MKRCTACVAKNLRSFGATQRGQRWVSSDKSALTHEAIRERISGRFREDKYGNDVKVNSQDKTISTPSGELPMSPLFNADWIKARRRTKKTEPAPPSGRFRKKLARNPFAKALATPFRICPITRIYAPRYFMQDYEVVKNPETGDAWWAPGPLSFTHVQRRPKQQSEDSDAAEAEETAATEEKEATGTEVLRDGDRFRRHAITAYSLSRKSLVDSMGENKKKGTAAGLLGPRTGMAMSNSVRNPVWRQDMGDFLLQMMRSQAAKSLADRAQDRNYNSIEPCQRWDDIKDVKRRGCVLWLPKDKETAATQYATYDIEGAKYGAKMPVHNLFWLLGENCVAGLREASGMFRDNELLVLKTQHGKSMGRLHMLLWRLQGYLYKSNV